MVGHVLARGRHGHQALLAHQLVQQLGVVDHLVVATHLRVLVAQGVEAVGAGDHDLALRGRHTVEHLVELLDVLLRQHLEQELVARAARGVAGAGLALAEHEEVHGGHVEQLGDGLGGLLGAVLVGAGAADPEQVLVAVEGIGVLTEDGDLDVHLVDPRGALAGVLAPGVALVLEVLEQARQLVRELRLDEHLVAAHVHDVVHVLDVHRALLDAGATGGAAPQDLGVDDAAEVVALAGRTDQRAGGLGAGLGGDLLQLVGLDLAVLADQAHLVAAHIGAATGQQVRRLGVAVVAQAHDQQLRAQRLAGVPGGALALAAAALGAGGEVEPALPGEVLDPARAEGVVIGIGGLHLQDLAARHHRLRGAERAAAAQLALEVDVEEGREAVPRDAPGEVAAHEEQEHHAGHQLGEGEHRDQVRARGQQRGHVPGEEIGDRVGVAVGGDLARLHQDHAEALDEDDGLDRVRGQELAAGEAGEQLGVTRVLDLPDDDQHQDADHGADAEQLVHQPVDRPRADDGPVEGGVEGLRQRLEPEDGTGEEADHHHPVGDAHGAVLDHLGVGEELDHDLGGARDERRPAIGRGLPLGDDPHHAERPAEEDRPAEREGDRADRAQREGERVGFSRCGGQNVGVHCRAPFCPAGTRQYRRTEPASDSTVDCG
ncbi:hypothetical protein TSST111916_17520 [Tsukamurella strandjordii]